MTADEKRPSGSSGIKDPDNEFIIPAPMPDTVAGTHDPKKDMDQAGQQGGTHGGGKDRHGV